MALQRSHGRLRPTTAAADELPAGVAASAEPQDVRQSGRFADRDTARRNGQRGGLANARRRADAKAWGSSLGLGRLLEGYKSDEAAAPFIAEGEAWYAAQVDAVARDVGGGMLSPGVTSIVRTAAWERLWSAFLFDCATRGIFAWDVSERDADGKVTRALPRTELLAAASRLGDASRTNLLAAHELASREAQARPRGPVDPLAAFRLPAEAKP